MKIWHLTSGIYWHQQLYNVLPFSALEDSSGKGGLKARDDKEGENQQGEDLLLELLRCSETRKYFLNLLEK